jgi:phosphoribosyl-ATP pyrophosphohydrolase/phosphoribosyl-AMP cyclohydrolase
MTEKIKPWSMNDLDLTLIDRKAKMPEGSYTAALFRAGTPRIAQKVGEEGVEVAIAATRLNFTGEGRKELIEEVADLEFNIRVLLVNLNIPFNEVVETLRKRSTKSSLKGGDSDERIKT